MVCLPAPGTSVACTWLVPWPVGETGTTWPSFGPGPPLWLLFGLRVFWLVWLGASGFCWATTRPVLAASVNTAASARISWRMIASGRSVFDSTSQTTFRCIRRQPPARKKTAPLARGRCLVNDPFDRLVAALPDRLGTRRLAPVDRDGLAAITFTLASAAAAPALMVGAQFDRDLRLGKGIDGHRRLATRRAGERRACEQRRGRGECDCKLPHRALLRRSNRA